MLTKFRAQLHNPALMLIIVNVLVVMAGALMTALLPLQ